MPAKSFANMISARPGTALATIQKALTLAAAASFVGVRADCSFESVFPTTTVASADYSGVDRLLDQAYAYGMDYVWFSIGPYVSTGAASWTALLGTYGSSARLIKKRPPAGTAFAGWLKIIECLNALLAHIRAYWVSLGGDPTKLYSQIYQEWCIGASDGPSTDDVVGVSTARADAITAGHEGKVDTDALWQSMSGIAPGYANVRGAQDFAEYVYPRIVLPAGMHWVPPSMENQSSVASAERASFFGAGYTWWQAIEAATGEPLEVDIHNYRTGANALSHRDPLSAALKGANDGFYTPKALLEALYPTILTSETVWHISEYGSGLSATFGTTSDNGTWTTQGYGAHLCAMIDVHRSLAQVETVALEELIADPILGVETYSLINLAGNTALAVGGVARANGGFIDVTVASPPWGGSWVTAGAEVPV